MNCNTQNAKIASITKKTLIVGIDVGSETHYARAFDWRNYKLTPKSWTWKTNENGGREHAKIRFGVQAESGHGIPGRQGRFPGWSQPGTIGSLWGNSCRTAE